jgi:hypothetical protein
MGSNRTSAISGNKEGSEKGGGILNLIKTIVKDKLSN